MYLMCLWSFSLLRNEASSLLRISSSSSVRKAEKRDIEEVVGKQNNTLEEFRATVCTETTARCLGTTVGAEVWTARRRGWGTRTRRSARSRLRPVGGGGITLLCPRNNLWLLNLSRNNAASGETLEGCKTKKHLVHVLLLKKINGLEQIRGRKTNPCASRKEGIDVLHDLEWHAALLNFAAARLISIHQFAQNNTVVKIIGERTGFANASNTFNPSADFTFKFPIIAAYTLISKITIKASSYRHLLYTMQVHN